MILSHIVAVAKNGIIGYNNQIPWHLPQDLLRFKELTMGHTIIMGRKTFQSLPKHLEGRRYIVLSSKDYKVENVLFVKDLDSALLACAKESEVFIIGGGDLYRQTLSRVDRVYLTLIDLEPLGDTYYPINELTGFKILETKTFIDQPNYTYQTLECNRNQ